MSDKDEEKKPSDTLTGDYGAVLRESALLTSFAGFLFGFLLNISVSSAASIGSLGKVIILVALSSSTISISLFIMPVIYHHLEYPYLDFEKFKKRSHMFTLYGLILALITLFLGIELAMTSLLGENPLVYFLGMIPFVLIYVFYRLRK